MSTLKISGRQLKAARALLGWSQSDLADKAGASRPTVERIESQDDGPVEFERHARADQVVAALVAAGIEFIGDVGVKLDARRRRR
jgi:transcriptional regulator with XRE-family HTH domain